MLQASAVVLSRMKLDCSRASVNHYETCREEDGRREMGTMMQTADKWTRGSGDKRDGGHTDTDEGQTKDVRT